MKRLLFLCILAAQLLVSCGTKESRMQDFINEYNTLAPMIQASNQSIKGTLAKMKGPDKIELVFNYDIPFDESYKATYAQIAPSMLANVFKGQPKLAKLLDDGVTFDVVMTAADDQVLAELQLDKAKVDAMIQKQNGDAGSTSITTGGKDEQLQSMLAIMNKNLPIVDKQAGTKITKIDINENKELVYTVEVSKALANVIKSEAAKQVMKENIMRNDGLKIVFNGVERYGVAAVRYLYIDQSGKTASDILIKRSDIR
jgi:hypothetical protein